MNPFSQSTLQRLTAPFFFLLGMSLLCSCASTGDPEPTAVAVPERAPTGVREAINEELVEVFAPIDERSQLLNSRHR